MNGARSRVRTCAETSAHRGGESTHRLVHLVIRTERAVLFSYPNSEHGYHALLRFEFPECVSRAVDISEPPLSEGLQPPAACGLQCGVRAAQRCQAARGGPQRAPAHDTPLLLPPGREPEALPLRQQSPHQDSWPRANQLPANSGLQQQFSKSNSNKPTKSFPT